MNSTLQRLRTKDGHAATHQPASMAAGSGGAQDGLARQQQQQQGQQIAQLRVPAGAGVIQLSRKGKPARRREKEAEQKKASDRQLDPNNKALSDGLDSEFTGTKLDTSEQQGGQPTASSAGAGMSVTLCSRYRLARPFSWENAS